MQVRHMKRLDQTGTPIFVPLSILCLHGQPLYIVYAESPVFVEYTIIIALLLLVKVFMLQVCDLFVLIHVLTTYDDSS